MKIVYRQSRTGSSVTKHPSSTALARSGSRILSETRIDVHRRAHRLSVETAEPVKTPATSERPIHPRGRVENTRFGEKWFDVRPACAHHEIDDRHCKATVGNVEWLMPQCGAAALESEITLPWIEWLFPRSVLALDLQPKVARIITGSLLVTASLVTVLFALVGARDLHDTWDNWRSDRLVKEAEGHFGSGDYGSGFARANKAYLDCPQNDKAIRCLARRCEEVGAAEALYFFDLLERMEKMTDEDSVVKVSAMVKRNQFKEAQTLTLKLLNSGHASDRLMELGCALDNGGFAMPSTFKEHMRERLLSPHDSKHTLSLAGLWMKSGATSQREMAASCLWKLAESEDASIARKAAAALHEGLSPGDPSSKYLAWMMTEQPGADAAQHIRALSRIIGVTPGGPAPLLAEIATEWRDRPAEERTMLGRLIFALARPKLLTGLFSREDAVKHPHVAELYVAGMMGADKMDECMALLKDRQLPVTRAQRSYAEAKLTILGKCSVNEARHRLLCALGAASAEANPCLLSGVAELAVQQGIPAVAVQAYEECLTIHGSEATAYDGLVTVYDATGETEKLGDTIRRALSLWPGNEQFLEKSVYVNLLMGTDLERSFALAERLQAERPGDDMRMFLLTMAHARFGNTVGTRVELRKLIVKGGIPSRYSAVIGGLLKGAGDSAAAARAIFDVTERDITLPEEKAFLALARL